MWQSHGCGVAEGRGRSGMCSAVEVKRTWRKGGRGGGGGWGWWGVGWGGEMRTSSPYSHTENSASIYPGSFPTTVHVHMGEPGYEAQHNTLENTHR